MKRLLCAVAAIALITPAIAAAQRPDNRQHGNRTEQTRHSDQRQKNRQAKPQRTRRTTRVTRTVERPNRATRVTRTVERPSRVTRVTRTVERPARISRRTVFRIGERPSSFHRIRARTFRYPRGYHYRRWSRGSILPRLFLSGLYLWTDWAALGLGAPPPGYVWVRYGPDLLLVNRFNGRIADVIYGAFY